MADEPALIYLEPDDEITSVVRRLRAADAPRVVIVAPGRSKATSSAVALRLLERVVSEEGRQVAVVGDALTRSLAAEAGLTTYASVADAADARPAVVTEPRQAAIHVVRGDEPTLSVPTSPRRAPPPARMHDAARSDDATAVVPAVRPGSPPAPKPRPRTRARGARRLPVAALAALLAVLVVAGAAAAAILPAAVIHITPAGAAVGPTDFDLTFDDPQIVSGTERATQEGTASGTYEEHTPAGGTAVFLNWNAVAVEVPAGTAVAAGEVTFGTAATIVVPAGTLTSDGRIQAGEGAVAIGAIQPGTAGNVAAHAIDTILDDQTDRRLRGFPNNPERTIDNPEATAGGLDAAGPEIIQADVDAAVAALTEALQAKVAVAVASGEGVVAADPVQAPQPTITGADGLVGTRDQPTFELSGELAYERGVVPRSDVEAAARARITDDASVVPAGQELIGDSIAVSVESARREGQALVATVSVTARAAMRIEAEAVAERVAGLPIAEAQRALADLGAVEIATWPGWVDTVPAFTWRIEVQVEVPLTPSPSPSVPEPSGSPGS